ncbi:hypothetical protein RchiOBHm_Chr4g0399081 [Rosa chinensis]|uniref:Uncharacterized protein n=1 Tax=Rosa chinensis TaxID=74649 RepID=A0A2P6QSF5_ROSCH|nr:hypothetical protein RchiOBHm_Chr4g0399081 [Rosa chinensis]
MARNLTSGFSFCYFGACFRLFESVSILSPTEVKVCICHGIISLASHFLSYAPTYRLNTKEIVDD